MTIFLFLNHFQKIFETKIYFSIFEAKFRVSELVGTINHKPSGMGLNRDFIDKKYSIAQLL